MKLVIPQESTKQILAWIQRGLFASAVLMLAYCGYVVVGAWMFQRRANAELDLRLATEAYTSAQGPKPATPAPAVAIALNSVIGRLSIPRLGVSVIVVEGTSVANLRHAAGHIPQTGVPGVATSNAGIAAHRDTFFRPLKDIRIRDLILFTQPSGELRYRVVSTRVVPPSEISVLNPGPVETLTLVTCFPFYFVGDAPDRFIVRAERIL